MAAYRPHTTIMTPAGRVFEVDEIFQEICRHATLPTLMKLSRVSKAANLTVRHTLNTEIDYHLEVYTDRAQDIWDIMVKTNSVLLGHVPLAIVLMNEDVRSLSNPVLMIATPIRGAEDVRRALMDRGYERIMGYRDRREDNIRIIREPKGKRTTHTIAQANETRQTKISTGSTPLCVAAA